MDSMNEGITICQADEMPGSDAQYWDQAKWVGAPASAYEGDAKPGSALLRRNFMLTERVERAWLYITARGVYDCRINGKRVGELICAPGALGDGPSYQVFDVTEHVRLSGNAFGVAIAPLRFAQQDDPPALRALLSIEQWNGEILRFPTDPDKWRYRLDGPVRSALWQEGERYDARLYDVWVEAFDQKGSLAGWRVTKEIVPEKPCVGDVRGPFAQDRELHAARLLRSSRGYVYDMGEIVLGMPSVSFTGVPGARIYLRYGTSIDQKGDLTDASSIMAEYICATGQRETYRPVFAIHSYRYVEIIGVEQPPQPEDVLGYVYR